MAKKRCGDLAGFTFKVTSELVGKYAITLVCRRKKFKFTADQSEELKQEETKKVVWPDLPDLDKGEDVFYGGRQVDFRGLNKLSYDEKFQHQEFGLSIYVGEHDKKSTGLPLEIEGYPDVQQTPLIEIGIPMPVEQFLNVTNPTTGVVERQWIQFSSGAGLSAHNCGRFHLELKDGVVTITVKINITSVSGGTGKKKGIFKDIKKRTEQFWNSADKGFLQWVYHRENCKRRVNCDCRIVRDRKGKFVQAGCCKVPVRLSVQRGPDCPITVTHLTPGQLSQLRSPQRRVPGLRADSTHLYWPENRANTYAHEVGHMMGFPDQYPTGTLEVGARVGGEVTFEIDDSSVMGTSQGAAKKEHISAEWFKTWIQDNVERPMVVQER